MPIYEYRCRTCGSTHLLTAAEKAREDGQGKGATCSLTCHGTLRRVWASSVAVATVPGFHKHDTQGAVARE